MYACRGPRHHVTLWRTIPECWIDERETYIEVRDHCAELLNVRKDRSELH